MVTNDLRERDEQIAMLSRKEAIACANLERAVKANDQDAIVRLQLGRRLEQVLIEKEEALEELEMLKVQLEEIRTSFSKVIGNGNQ